MLLPHIVEQQPIADGLLSVSYQHEEVWREVRVAPNYLVSNLGRVRSAKWRHPTPLMAQRYFKGGKYLHVALRVDGATKPLSVHRLVADAFCEKREGRNVVNHIDGNRTNNRASNLEWVTASENHRHAIDVLGVPYGKSRRKAVEAILPDGTVWKRFESTRDAERQGFTSAHVCGCANGTRKTHRGMTWRYVDV